MSKFARYNKDEIREAYNHKYLHADFRRFPIAEQQFIRATVKKYKLMNKQVLDLGCGTGKYTSALNDAGTSALGIDLSEQAIKVAKLKHPGIRYEVGDATNLRFNESSLDAIFCSGLSLFNEPNLNVLQDFMNLTMQKIKKGGLFIFVKTTSLTDRPSKGYTRFDYTLESYLSMFRRLENARIIGAYATYPHTFILFGQLGFSRIITKISEAITRITRVPLRTYIILRRT